MKLKIYKPAIAAFALILAAGSPVFAQVAPVQPAPPVAQPSVSTNVSVDAPVAVTATVDTKALKAQLHELKKQLRNLNVNVNAQVAVALKDLDVNVNTDLAGIAPQIALGFKDMGDGLNNDGKLQDGNQQVKNYSKSYSADANDILSIENRFGKVTVNTWDKNEFKVDVQIKVEASSDDEAKQMLDNISISDSKDGNNVNFKTNIGSESNSWSSWLGGRHHAHKMEIDYTVYMPAKNALTIDNSYGATILPDLAGNVTVNSSYGSFTAGSLSSQSTIRVKYGSANIDNLGSGTLDVSYGSLQLGSADVLHANVSYSSANIGKIHTEGAINLRYSGGLRIADVDRDMKSLAINASYSNVNIGLSGDENANFNVSTHYGGFDYGGHSVTITSKTPSDSDRGPHFTYNYKGYLGKGNPDKNISVNTSYGSVKFE